MNEVEQAQLEQYLYRQQEQEVMKNLLTPTEVRMSLNLIRPVTGNIDAINKCRAFFNRSGGG